MKENDGAKKKREKNWFSSTTQRTNPAWLVMDSGWLKSARKNEKIASRFTSHNYLDKLEYIIHKRHREREKEEKILPKKHCNNLIIEMCAYDFVCPYFNFTQAVGIAY